MHDILQKILDVLQNHMANFGHVDLTADDWHDSWMPVRYALGSSA